MDALERKSLAEQMDANPLTYILIMELEKIANDVGVNAAPNDNETRASAMAEVRAIRAFRRNLQRELRDTPKVRPAPA